MQHDQVRLGWFHQSGMALVQQLKSLQAEDAMINIITHVPEANWTGKFRNVKSQWEQTGEIDHYVHVFVDFDRYT